MTKRARERRFVEQIVRDGVSYGVVRLVLLIAALALAAACGELQSGALAGGRASLTPSATPTPDVALRLMDRVRNMTALVRRVDKIAAAQEKWGDILARSGSQQPGADPNEDIWVIAVVGEIYPSFGVMATGPGACGTFFYDFAGTIKGSGVSSLSGCAPYFRDSLVPASAPVSCGPEPQGYFVFDHYTFSRTIPGPVPLGVTRDDRWVQPRVASGQFLYNVVPGSSQYYATFCRPVHMVTVPNQSDSVMLEGLGSPRVSPPRDLAQIWLKDVHAISATADETGVVTVLSDRRPGFEIASYDWRALAPQGGYIKFRFVDAAGADVIVYAVANGP
jgi:hypothetical protein